MSTFVPGLPGRSRRSRQAIPTVDMRALAPAARRTRVLLLLLPVLALALAIWLCLAPRQNPLVPAALQGGNGVMVVVDVSASTLQYTGVIGQSLQVLARNPSQRVGLVLNSDSAYVALPPQAPGSALRGWQRMISYVARKNKSAHEYPAPGDFPWVGVFTGGTRLSAGLASAAGALRQAGVKHGHILLISDLRDAPEDLPLMSALIARLHQQGTQLRVIPVGEAATGRAFNGDEGDAGFILNAADTVYAPARTPALPTQPPQRMLVVLGLALAGVLAVAEFLLPPLSWRTRTAGGAR